MVIEFSFLSRLYLCIGKTLDCDWLVVSSARFCLFLAPPQSRSLRVSDYIDPLRVRRWLGVIVVVPVPPLVRRGLGITVRRVLPSLLTAEWRDIEVAPHRPHRFVAARADEVCSEHLVAVAEKHVVAVPFIDPEVLVEAVGHRVPRHFPAHPFLQTRDVRLRRARGPGEGGVTSVQMGEVRDLISSEGTAAASVVGPPEHSRLQEGAIDDQLPAALEQVEQANLTLGSLELILLLDRHPRHPAPPGGERITRAGEGLLFHQKLLPRSLPLLRRNNRGCLHCGMSFRVLLVYLFPYCHFISPDFLMLSETNWYHSG